MARRFRNTRRENRLEELGRVDAEKAYTSKGKRNLREEKDRIRSELKSGGRVAQDPKQRQKQQKQQKPKGVPGLGKKVKPSPKKYPPKRYMKPLRAQKAIGGRANLLEEMGRIDARRHPDRADRAEKRRVIRELNKGYNSGGVVLKGKKVGCQIK